MKADHDQAKQGRMDTLRSPKHLHADIQRLDLVPSLLRPGRVRKYCDEYVCLCLSVCLSVGSYN